MGGDTYFIYHGGEATHSAMHPTAFPDVRASACVNEATAGRRLCYRAQRSRECRVGLGGSTAHALLVIVRIAAVWAIPVLIAAAVAAAVWMQVRVRVCICSLGNGICPMGNGHDMWAHHTSAPSILHVRPPHPLQRRLSRQPACPTPQGGQELGFMPPHPIFSTTVLLMPPPLPRAPVLPSSAFVPPVGRKSARGWI